MRGFYSGSDTFYGHAAKAFRKHEGDRSTAAPIARALENFGLEITGQRLSESEIGDNKKILDIDSIIPPGLNKDDIQKLYHSFQYKVSEELKHDRDLLNLVRRIETSDDFDVVEQSRMELYKMIVDALLNESKKEEKG